ncbi:MAG: ATP synthase F1 subunit epsilon [Alphaproteobacteria bacterium]|nr:ATP synthase F1 subunit epsilon [Alphaproteobacteria bacterium]
MHPPGKITFELVSPERLLLSQQVDMVVVPGSEGYFGVLIGHTPLISTLKPGVIDVYDGGKITERIFVGGGFAEATPDRCVVLAETALPIAEIDRTRVVERIAEIRALETSEALVVELEVHQAMLDAVDRAA